MSDIYGWSLTASENAGADSFMNWCEGQPPHTVNNSARVMMQRVREYLTDTGGAVESIVVVDWAQQQTAIRLQSTSRFLEYKNDIVVRFRSSGWNVGASTVSINGLKEKTVYKATEGGISALVGGEIQNGCIYTLVYDEAIDGWQLLNPTPLKVSPFKRFPSGFIGSFAMESLPDGWLLCDGSAYSRTAYRNLFATIGTMWGHGDGETTFNVPDMRGMFLRGFDYLGNVDRERSFASTQRCSLRTHDHIIGTDETKASSSRRKRDLSSVNPSHRQRRSANEVSEEEKQAREAENLRRRNSRKRCFSANLWGYEDPDCWGGSPSVDHGNVGEEECVGLTGDALERCEKAFESVTQTTQEEASPHPSEGHSSRPFFIKYQDNFYMFPVPKRADQEFGVHKHRIMTDSFGGEETRPINVSVVFGIKT